MTEYKYPVGVASALTSGVLAGFNHHSMQTWLAWRDFMGHQWHPGSKTVFEVFEELEQLKEDNPDKWAAFVAARRIHGKEV